MSRILVVLSVAACMPLSIVYLQRLWSVPHYQFFPLVLGTMAVFFWMAWSASDEDESEEKQDEAAHVKPKAENKTQHPYRYRWLLLVWFGLLIEGLALSVYSPWLGFLGLIFTGWGVIAYAGGEKSDSYAPIWSLLLLLIRPPLQMDEVAILWLQQKTASLSSAVLDLYEIDHLREGVLIEIPGHVMFVEEACSGVQSLFSLIAMAAILAVWNGRSLVWSLLLIASAAVGAALMNLVRIVSVVFALEWYQTDLLAEPQHTFLGLGVFLLALIWLVCWDQLFQFFMGPIKVNQRSDISRNRWIISWNRWITGLKQKAPTLEIDPAAPIGATTPPASTNKANGSQKASAQSISVIASLGVASILLVFGAGKVVLAEPFGIVSNDQPTASQARLDFTEQMRTLQEEAIPEELSGWKRKGFEIRERNPGSMFGDYSHEWRFNAPMGEAIFSVDFPFIGWHDLRTCYSGIGWTQTSSKTIKSDTDVSSRCEVKFSKPSGQSAFLVFGSYDQNLNEIPVPVREPHTRSLVDRLTYVVKDKKADNFAAVQFQLILISTTELTEDEQRTVRKQFEELVRTAIQKVSKEKETTK